MRVSSFLFFLSGNLDCFVPIYPLGNPPFALLCSRMNHEKTRPFRVSLFVVKFMASLDLVMRTYAIKQTFLRWRVGLYASVDMNITKDTLNKLFIKTMGIQCFTNTMYLTFISQLITSHNQSLNATSHISIPREVGLTLRTCLFQMFIYFPRVTSISNTGNK